MSFWSACCHHISKDKTQFFDLKTHISRTCLALIWTNNCFSTITRSFTVRRSISFTKFNVLVVICIARMIRQISRWYSMPYNMETSFYAFVCLHFVHKEYRVKLLYNAVTWFALIVIYLGVVSSYSFETFIVIMNIVVVIIVIIIIRIASFIVVLQILSLFLSVLILLLIHFLFIIVSIIIIIIIMVIITHRLSCVQNKLKKEYKRCLLLQIFHYSDYIIVRIQHRTISSTLNRSCIALRRAEYNRYWYVYIASGHVWSYPVHRKWLHYHMCLCLLLMWLFRRSSGIFLAN